ncbi:MAG: formate dehydrogenase accessory sulfurtransferase FdhD, partial [Chloroflexi bacterium]|nr:formate dehydrogenase accessory sulfurtransferase FdhD [Chloroflexota bacterium]
MMDGVEEVSSWLIDDEGTKEVRDTIVRESPLTISLDNQEIATLLCSPTNQKLLAVGLLFSEGLLTSRDEIKKVVVDSQRGIVWIETMEGKDIDPEILSKRMITSGCGRGASFYSAADMRVQGKVQFQTRASPQEIFALVNRFQHHSELYRNTHGVHSAALCDPKSILVFHEDIGR